MPPTLFPKPQVNFTPSPEYRTALALHRLADWLITGTEVLAQLDQVAIPKDRAPGVIKSLQAKRDEIDRALANVRQQHPFA